MITRGVSRAPVTVVTIVAVTTAAIILAAVTGMGPDPVMLGALGLLVGCIIWCLADLSNRVTSTDGIATTIAPAPVAHVDHRLMSLRNGIAYGRVNDASVERLRTALVELVDDQLRTVHGIDPIADPDGAAAVLGPELAELVADPSTARHLTRSRDLDRIVTLIERL